MNKLTNIIIGNKVIDEKKNFIWNMIGSGVFSFISMFLSVCVIQIMGEKEGGIFSIAITISQMLLYIAYFEQRTYQVTDVERKYTFAQYHGAKICVCAIMFIVSIGYVALKQYPVQKTEIILLMCIYRMIDGYADLYEGQFQLENRLYLSGKSMAFRSMLSAASLLVGLVVTKNMIAALCIAIAVAVIGVIVFDINVEQSFGSIKPDFKWNGVKNIIKECFPLFMGAFLWVYILSASRISVDGNMSSEYVAYYQILFMPISIINLFATFFFRPALTVMSEMYSKNKFALFKKKVRNLLLLIMGFTVICMVGSYILGIPVLSMISGCDLETYKSCLVLLMIAGGINSASFFMYYVLTIIRKPKNILFGYITAAGVSLIISDYFVQRWKIMGAAWSFLITVTYLLIVFLLSFYIHMKQNDKK